MSNLRRKAKEMRDAIDMIEGALMGLDDFDFENLPRIYKNIREDLQLAPIKMTVGQMRRLCAALAECTRIINSDEYEYL